MEAVAAAEPALSSPSTAAAAPRPPKQRPRQRRSGPAEEQVRVRRRTLEAVLEQCQRTLEMLKNADLEPDPDAGDEIWSKGSAGEEEDRGGGRGRGRGGAIVYPKLRRLRNQRVLMESFLHH